MWSLSCCEEVRHCRESGVILFGTVEWEKNKNDLDDNNLKGNCYLTMNKEKSVLHRRKLSKTVVCNNLKNFKNPEGEAGRDTRREDLDE